MKYWSLNLFFYGLLIHSTSLFAKGPIFDGFYWGENPLNKSQTISIRFEAYENFGTRDRILECNFNMICDFKAELREIRSVQTYAPNGDNFWITQFTAPASEQPIFKIITGVDHPYHPESILLVLEGSGMRIPLKRMR